MPAQPRIVRTALHEHLGTGKYTGNFDAVIDRAVKRLGDGGIFSVVSIGNDRLPSDRRYETFVDSRSTKYEKIDLNGRATLVHGKVNCRTFGLTVYNGIEYELDNASLLVTGLRRETNPLGTGPMSAINISDAVRTLKQLNNLRFVVHPFSL